MSDTDTDYDPYTDPNSELYDPYADPDSPLYDPYLDPDAPWKDWPKPDENPVVNEEPGECFVDEIGEDHCVEICFTLVTYADGTVAQAIHRETVPCPKPVYNT